MKFEKPLTPAQSTLVENSLNIAQWTVRNYISANHTISGLSYDDLLQEAYLALCGAATTYQGGQVQFKTYAVAVIRNHLIDYCRRIYHVNRSLPTISLDAPPSDPDCDSALMDTIDVDTNFEDWCLSQIWIRDFFAQRKANYSGCTKLGIEALELKVLDGYGVTDIAHLYHTRPNLVGAWISKATRKLREEFAMAENFMPDVENCRSHS